MNNIAGLVIESPDPGLFEIVELKLPIFVRMNGDHGMLPVLSSSGHTMGIQSSQRFSAVQGVNTHMCVSFATP